MAYLKYKELTKYFNFYKELSNTDLPAYVTDYIDKDETVYSVYATRRDKGVFTNKRIILFDVRYGVKQIHSIFYESISTISVLFGLTSSSLIIYADSGYPVRLKFINQKAEDKTALRILYTKITKMINKNN